MQSNKKNNNICFGLLYLLKYLVDFFHSVYRLQLVIERNNVFLRVSNPV